MANAQKIGSAKSLQRSARHKGRNSASRPERIKIARRNHIKNAKRSCGVKFATKLEKYYQDNPNPGKKAGRRK